MMGMLQNYNSEKKYYIIKEYHFEKEINLKRVHL